VVVRGFEEPRNGHLAGRVELLGVAALLYPAVETKDGGEPTAAFFTAAALTVTFFATTTASAAFFTTAAVSATFFTATMPSTASFTSTVLFVAFFTAIASFTTFFAAAASSAALFAATVSSMAQFTAAASSAAFLSTATDGSCGVTVVATRTYWPMNEILPVIDPPLPDALICICSGMSSSDDTSSLLRMVHTTFPLLLLWAKVVSAPPWPPVASAPGIRMP
jgi:hypothetical protein